MGWQSTYLSLSARGKRCGLDICELWIYIAADEERGFWGLYEKICTNDLRMNTLLYKMYHQDNKVIILKEENDDALFIAPILVLRLLLRSSRSTTCKKSNNRDDLLTATTVGRSQTTILT